MKNWRQEGQVVWQKKIFLKNFYRKNPGKKQQTKKDNYFLLLSKQQQVINHNSSNTKIVNYNLTD